MSPESICCNENEAPSDVWALGCVVIKMITGKSAWNCRANADVSNLLFRIGFTEESPEIPGELSEEGKDFLRKCLVRDPKKRWTAEMLLNHPFIAAAADDDDDNTVPFSGFGKSFSSPRSAFDFPESWNSSHLSSVERSNSNSNSNDSFRGEFDQSNSSSSLTDRIRELGMQQQHPNWSSSDSWVVVRQTESPVS
ncbi:Protein kinase domain [Macleaya cordata]|uniref:Protein kinase domain n=1 Tax=Macleaya cordata TaxID=56857 RepID=A0A200PSH4_MACCD|nr:Protein kinase domain [Macleaya cordata]